MKRRAFLSTSAATAVAATSGGCKIVKNERREASRRSPAPGRTLAGREITVLREQYRSDLFDDYLPFLDRHVIDHEYGGFMCNTDYDGKNLTTRKRTWFEGRGIWVYSFLYNNVDSDPKHRDVARKSVELFFTNNKMGKDLWPVYMTREGKPVEGPDPIFYGDMFIANGLQEYSRASGDEKWWDMAKEIMLKCIDIYDNRPDYGNLPKTETAPAVIRPRQVGHWFVLLRCGTQMLEKRPDPDIEAIVDRCVDAIMNHHYNPEHGLICEYLNHDLSRIESDYSQVATGHGIETMWMVMFEAIRRKDRALFDRASNVLEHSCEVFWDDIYGGFMGGLQHIDDYVWQTGKSLWLQEEVLIGTLCAIEHTGAGWAKSWYSREYEYVRENFTIKERGYPIWILYDDRKVVFKRNYNRIGNFHHPRHLMMNLLALDRMIERGGEVSDLFA